MRLGEIAAIAKGELVGDPSLQITGVAPLDEAARSDISFAEDLKRLPDARNSGAGALILPKEVKEFDRPYIRVPNPRLAFAQVLGVFAPETEFTPGIDGKAYVHSTAQIGSNATIMAGAYVGPRAIVGSDTIIYPNVFVGQDVKIGADCLIYPNVVIRENVQIGDRVIIQPGAVLGGDGFGYVDVDGKHIKVPHIGRVIIEDDVEIGANVTIDKGTCGKTVVGRGTKIDNLVQLGHNVRVGEDCLIVAMAGIAGSARIGNRVTLAGQSGVTGHVTVGDDSVIFARGVVAGDLPPGSFVSGFPARPHPENMRLIAVQRKIPDLIKQVKELEHRLEELENRQRR